MKQRRVGRRAVALSGLALVVGACGSDGATDQQPANQDSAPAEMNGPEVVDGVLQPLADGFPEHPITLWSAFPAGHPDDLLNNVVAEIASDVAPVRVVTDVFQAGPNIQYELVDILESEPRSDEGYHAFSINWLGLALRPYTQETLADVQLEDLRHIAGLMFRPFVFAVNQDSQFDSLEDVAQWAQDNPGELRVVASSTGSAVHVSTVAWAEAAGIDMRFIPTDGSGESRTVMLGGGADLSAFSYFEGAEEEFKVLAVTGDQPVSTMPDVPSLADLGFDVPSGSLNGYGTIPAVSDAHVAWLEQLFSLVLEDPRFEEAYVGADIGLRTADEVLAAQESQIEIFYPILDELELTTRPLDR